MNHNEAHGKKIVVVTAHPDDEMGFGSVLSYYARRGAEVRIVCLTLGQKGFRDHIDVDDGEELARLREKELRASSSALGIEPPMALEFVDKELLGPAQERARERVREILDQLVPDVVITFGPDGITGHQDHRAVGCFVTETLQAREHPPRLFHWALTLEHVAEVERHTGRRLLGVARAHLDTCVRVSDEDVERGVRAIGAYRSQFAPDALKDLQEGFRGRLGEVYFRRVLPGTRSGEELAVSLFGPDRGHTGNDRARRA